MRHFVYDNQACDLIASGRQPATLVSTLLRNFQTLLGRHLHQPLLFAPRSEQHDALRSEPWLGEPYQMLDRIIAGVAKELD